MHIEDMLQIEFMSKQKWHQVDKNSLINEIRSMLTLIMSTENARFVKAQQQKSSSMYEGVVNDIINHIYRTFHKNRHLCEGCHFYETSDPRHHSCRMNSSRFVDVWEIHEMDDYVRQKLRKLFKCEREFQFIVRETKRKLQTVGCCY